MSGLLSVLSKRRFIFSFLTFHLPLGLYQLGVVPDRRGVGPLRLAVFRHLVDIHMTVKEYTDAVEWDKIMTVFNKDITLTVH